MRHMRTRIAVFLITLSGLILEVGLTRIYSASIWYHFAFVAISVALLGWGLGGFTIHLMKQWLGKQEAGGRRQTAGEGNAEGGKQEADGRRQTSADGTAEESRRQKAEGGRQTAGRSTSEIGGQDGRAPSGARTLSMNAAAVTTLLYAGAIPLCLWLLVRYPFEMDRLPLYFLAPLLPFFLAGMALSIVFDIHRAVAGSLYFYDLIGAALGAVLVTVLLHLFGGEAALLVATVAPAVAAGLLATGAGEEEGTRQKVEGSKPDQSSGQNARAPMEGGPPATAGGSDWLPRLVQVAAALGVVLAIIAAVSAVKYETFRVKPGRTKAMRNQMDENPHARIAHTGWNAYSRIDAVEGVAPGHVARLYIDSDAWTSINEWDGRLESAKGLRDSYRALPFRLTSNAETLVIGPGGGADVVSALASGSRKVTAVELNPLMLKFVRSYGARAGNLYDRPDVETIQSEGRNFISRTGKKFDIIFMGFVDSWASVASGGLSLSENYLYTAEAMRAYYDHLKDDGIVVVLRWRTDIPRLTSNAVATLGAGEAAKRVVVLLEKRGTPSDPPQMLFMLRKRPFNEAELKEIREQCTDANVEIAPGGSAPPGIKEVLAGTKTLDQYEAESPKFVGPVWDNSPFYFADERPWRMHGAIAERILTWLLAPSVGMLAVFAVFGRPRRKKAESRRQTAEGRRQEALPSGNSPYVASLVYFAMLGFGFIAVELALLQHLTLLVGHPIFTLSVLLFTLLAFGGIGAALSPRWSMWKACAAVAIIGTIEALALPKLVPALLWLPLWGRIAVAIALMAPLGLAMGMPFPRGLKHTGEGSLPAPPFYWGLNGIMSVIGSVTTVFVALNWGFQAAMLMGSACYVLAAVASMKAFPRQLAVSGEQ
jgi:predicted membrane-bound spermidine synthase